MFQVSYITTQSILLYNKDIQENKPTHHVADIVITVASSLQIKRDD